MSNFVLVHGAWLGAWAWDQVVERLEGAGESQGVDSVLALDLPGHGRRFVDEIRRITVEHYIQSVVTPVQLGRLQDVVLVGHGFSATFLPQVALALGPEVVKRVVFIAGELPPEGTTSYDRLSRWDKAMLRLFKAPEKGFKFPDLISKSILCGGLDGAASRDVLSRLVPEPFMPWLTPVSRQGFPGSLPTAYLVLTGDKAIRPGLQRRYSQSLGSPQVEEISAGHGAVFSHPQEIANILLKYA